MTSDAEKRAREYLAFMNSERQPHLGSPWENMQDVIRQDPEYAWAIILAAVSIADGNELSLVGTGPLEQLLVQYPDYVQRAIDLALRDDNFRDALRSADIRGGDEHAVAKLDDFFDAVDHVAE